MKSQKFMKFNWKNYTVIFSDFMNTFLIQFTTKLKNMKDTKV